MNGCIIIKKNFRDHSDYNSRANDASRESGITEDVYFLKSSGHCHMQRGILEMGTTLRDDNWQFVEIYRDSLLYFFSFFVGTMRVGWGKGDFTSRVVTP